VPASAQAATSALPNFAYGPTVVHTTVVRRATASTAAGSSASTRITGISGVGSSFLTCASLSAFRPAIAQRSGRWRLVCAT